MAEIRRDDSGQMILDDILLEENEFKETGYEAPYAKECEDEATLRLTVSEIYVADSKDIRRRCFDLMNENVQANLANAKAGHDLRKIEKVVEGRAKVVNYLESVLCLLAVSGKINSLYSHYDRLSKENGDPSRIAGVLNKIRELEALEGYLIGGIENYTAVMVGRSIDRKKIKQSSRSKDQREYLRKKLRNDFINRGQVEFL